MNTFYIEEYQRRGYSFFNIQSAEKKCNTRWQTYQDRKPTQFEIKQWLRLPTQNWAITCGEISNLIVIDVDTRNGADASPFLNRGFHQINTPSGGYHFYFNYNPLLKSTKHKRQKNKGILFAVDIQSNKSLVFAPPSSFNGKPYTVANDAPIKDIPEDLLIQILEALEPEKDSVSYTPYIAPQTPENGRPGDIFNALASWDEVLLPLGWESVGQVRVNGVRYWKRPGKKEGISASTNWNGYDLFFPYTTSIAELEPMKGYTKFRLMAMLKYGGNFKEAAKALVMENYRSVNNLIK